MPQAPEGSPAEEATETPQQEGQEQGGAQDPSKVLTTIQQALAGTAKAVMGSKGIPQEAQKHLENAMNEYNAFMSIAGKAMGVQMPDADQSSMGTQDANAAGKGNAVSADQPMMKPGARPMMG